MILNVFRHVGKGLPALLDALLPAHSGLFSAARRLRFPCTASAAVSTEMPTSASTMAGRSFMPSPRKADACGRLPAGVCTISTFCLGDSSANSGGVFDLDGELVLGQSCSSFFPGQHLRGIDAKSPADGDCHIPVVAGQHPHAHVELAAAVEMAAAASLLGRIKKRQISQQDEVAARLPGDPMSCWQRFVGHRQHFHAVFQHFIHHRVDAVHAVCPMRVQLALVCDAAAPAAHLLNAALA